MGCMILQIRKVHEIDVYRDIHRIPEEHRKDTAGATILEGEVCKVTAGNRSAFVILRGKQGNTDAAAWMDERTKNRLGLSAGAETDLNLEVAGLWGQGRWAWSSSDPACRVSARLGLLSVGLGFVGLVLGVLSVWPK